MKVRSHYVYGYHTKLDWEWSASLPDPTWGMIDSMLRRMDSSVYAHVTLSLSFRDAYDQLDRFTGEPEPPNDHLRIYGGPSGYFMYCDLRERPKLYFVRPDATELGESVCVIPCDQGMWVEESLVFQDFEIVTTAARHFFENVEPAPQLRWEEYGWHKRS